MTSLLIYETIVPLQKDKHAGLYLEPINNNYEFTRNTAIMPLLAAEFPFASKDYPIAFVESGDELTPVAILGVEGNNSFLQPDGSWKATYIPAFARRYPFVYSSSQQGDQYAVCIDETYPGFNRHGAGEIVVNHDGSTTPLLEKTIEFMKEYEKLSSLTRNFCGKIQGLNLLETKSIRFSGPHGENVGLSGILIVNNDRLQELDADHLVDLMRTGTLDLIYEHIHSMRNLQEIAKHLAAQ